MQTLTGSKVRRCLFGPPDHEALRKDLEEALCKDNEMNTKYNFDFDNDSPLDGKYKWEVVDDKHYVPEFYKRGYPVKVQRRRINLDSVKYTSGNLSSLSFDSCVDTEKSDKSDSQENCGSSSQIRQNLCNKPQSLKQTQISAFMPKRKRSRSDVASSTVRSKAPRL